MSEEKMVEESGATDDAAVEKTGEVAEGISKDVKEEVEAAEGVASQFSPLKKFKKWQIITGVVVVVLVISGIGGFIWHEQPSFCNAICHTPMDPYLPTYEAQPGKAATDKWDNEVRDAGAMMAATHRVEGKTCMNCHVPTMGEQISEGMSWVSGNYVNPLTERGLTDLVQARKVASDDFCLNGSCHNMTRDELAQKTADTKFNPHRMPHGELDCGECHKAHRASVNTCTQCHSEATLPAGWLTAAEGKKIFNAAAA
ncbi:MAG: cytochrome c3 family protein [Raoultibacter sp.]